jgi:hypothetical protein
MEPAIPEELNMPPARDCYGEVIDDLVMLRFCKLLTFEPPLRSVVLPIKALLSLGTILWTFNGSRCFVVFKPERKLFDDWMFKLFAKKLEDLFCLAEPKLKAV